MNRNDEFMELKQELENTPSELEYIPAKAIARAKKQKRRSILWKTPAFSFCLVIVLFVLLVNLFPKVALAMSNVPILKDLVHAVAFDPSLRAAVEHDYYQVVGESQTKGDVTVTVDYMIVDPGHISLFFSVDAPVKSGLYHFDMRDPQGNGLAASMQYETLYRSGKLQEIQIDFTDDAYTIPDEIMFNITVNKDPDFQENMTVTLPPDAGSSDIASSDTASSAIGPDNADPVPVNPGDTGPVPTASAGIGSDTLNPASQEKAGTDYNFSFLLKPDSNYLKAVETIPLNQWLELKGQRIFLDHLNIYPTRSRLYVDCDDNNSSVLNGLGIYFKDEHGKIYDDRHNGISGTGTVDSFDIGSLYFESSYFSDAKKLTMYIGDITLIDKNRLYGLLNYTDKTVTNLPEGVTVASMELKDDTLTLTLKVDTGDPEKHPQLISMEYYDNENNTYNFNFLRGYSATDDPCYYEEFKIDNFKDNKYKIRWIYSPAQTLEEPVEISIK